MTLIPTGLKRAFAGALASAAVAAIALSSPGALSQRSSKSTITNAMPAVVMVVAVNVVDGRLVPVSSGSGTIVSADGSVLTNHHVLQDLRTAKLHDLFVIGRFDRADRAPRFVCAGRPERSVLKPELDLALIKCDLDMNGRPWQPRGWPTIAIGQSEGVVPGQRVLVLGYPNVGGSTIHVTAGLVSGWTGERGGAGSRAFMKTDAAITHGNSGGTAIDEDGAFIGVPTAFRFSTESSGGTPVAVGKVGLIRPVELARDLLDTAARGWTPGPGATPLIPAPPESSGVTVRGQVLDARSGAPISGAFVIVFQPELAADDIDTSKLEDQALAWGQSNAAGEFALDKPVARGASYTVAVVARGYQPRAMNRALVVPDDAPQVFEPWPAIRLTR